MELHGKTGKAGSLSFYHRLFILFFNRPLMHHAPLLSMMEGMLRDGGSERWCGRVSTPSPNGLGVDRLIESANPIDGIGLWIH